MSVHKYFEDLMPDGSKIHISGVNVEEAISFAVTNKSLSPNQISQIQSANLVYTPDYDHGDHFFDELI